MPGTVLGTEGTSTNKIVALKNPLNYQGEIDENVYQMQHGSCCAWGLPFSPLRIFFWHWGNISLDSQHETGTWRPVSRG